MLPVSSDVRIAMAITQCEYALGCVLSRLFRCLLSTVEPVLEVS